MSAHKILYIFPHPDDESFGPAAAIHKQRRMGCEVHLLTLTRGGATRQRHKLGYTIEEMGETRLREMNNMAKVLDLSSLTVWDFPDSRLKELDPCELEDPIEEHITSIEPDVIVTYPVHGISGFHDHLVTHALVKRVYCRMRASGSAFLRRLAFFTLLEGPHLAKRPVKLNASTDEEVDCAVQVDETDLKAARHALDCYVTYQEVIKIHRVIEHLSSVVHFEIFGEEHDPPLEDLCAGIGI